MAIGRRDGYAKGHDKGKKEGYDEGFAAGRLKLEIADLRDKVGARPGLDRFLFEDWKLPITDDVERKIRGDVQRLLPKHKHPTDEQWKMILSATPSTYVVAGAGSGKSTTLILRIILLHHYLGFELDAMTVVTFTKKSQEDFVGKLVGMSRVWGMPMSDDDARTVVCTFHSKILKFIGALTGGRVTPFEFYGDKSKEDPAVASSDTPFDTRLNSHQRALLNACYTEAYQSDESFRDLVARLYYHSLTQAARNIGSETMKRYVASMGKIQMRDKQSMDAIESAWRSAGQWPIKGVIPSREGILVQGHRFEVHGRMEGMPDVAVVLRPDGFPVAETVLPGAKYSVGQEAAVKKAVIDAYAGQKVIWVKSASDLQVFVKWLADRATIAPTFNYQVDGDLKSSPLLDCFVGAAAFIENLGLNVTEAVSSMVFKDENDPDSAFFEALASYWPKFMAHLDKQVPRVMTFNRIFSLFGEGCEGTLRLLPDSLIRSMSHLMIDEFQDISPQIVSWVKAVLAEARRRGPDLAEGRTARCSSLLCVGDDWQSIYGWRGSSPKYFVEFEERFPSPSVTRVMLRENFRSHQHVIDAAEHVVASTRSIPGKKAKAAGLAAADPRPVLVMDADDATLARLAAEHYSNGETVMVLYREGGEDERKRLEVLLGETYKTDGKLPKAKRRLELMTFHKSKGLEADAVFLSGDCRFKTSSPYRNHAYRLAKLGEPGEAYPYDSAQKEELLRLAYVGITRAAKHCYWFPGHEKVPTGKPKATDRLAGCGPFLSDLRKIK